MTYSAIAHRLLISAPGDIPESEIVAVIDAINRWNALHGPTFGSVVVPVHWRAHSAPSHGERPQETLNKQLVETADLVVALFWTRLGTPTGVASSGTVEEIDAAVAAGAYVGVLRCRRSVPNDVDTHQLSALRKYLTSVSGSSLVHEYTSEPELARHIDTTLTWAVAQRAGRTGITREVSKPADVWPRVEASERVKTDTKRRVRTETRYQLVLANSGDEAAEDVRFCLEPEQDGDGMPRLLDDRPVESLAPSGEARYHLALHLGTAPQARCVVNWRDSTGNHENRATLRFF